LRSYHRAMPGPSRVTLYEREGCHLCDDARVLLDEMLGSEGYARVDIEADDELVLRYGFRVPVVGLDGVDRIEAPISAPDLRDLVAELRD
jgi:glutaredoxin